MKAFDGNTEDERRLWHSYVGLARRHAISSGGSATAPAIVDDPNRLLSDQKMETLQTLLFSSFALEYRLKRVLFEMGRPIPEITLSPLFDRFWNELSGVDRLDKNGKCAPPAQWKALEPVLKKLIFLRNKMAHANYEDILKFLAQPDPPKKSREYYNAVVDAVMLINLGTGYEARSQPEVKKYFSALLVK